MAAPQVSAAQAIGEYLQSPDDLLKISAFRKKLEKEKASIDARLKSGVKEQLDATREGLTKLLGTRNNVQVIKEEMQIVDRMCSDPQNVVSTFDQISRVRHLLFTHSASLRLYRCLWCTGISNRRRRWSTIYWR
jgi:exocyst complex component 3